MIESILKIQFTTLTPVWTGGVDGKSSDLHLTGLIGSLRWWYEVFVRSVGGRACEPEKHLCSFDKTKPDKGLCDVCRVFGATGWARRFKLIIVEEKLQQESPVASTSRKDGSLVFNLSPDHPAAHTPGHKWYLPGKPLFGQVTLHIVPTVPLELVKKPFKAILGTVQMW